MNAASKTPSPWYADYRLHLMVFVVLALFMLKAVFGSGGGFSCGGPTTAANFKVVGLDGSQLTLDDLKGKVVFLNFWATWCKPCLREFPAIQNLQKRYADNPDFQVVAISCDEMPTRGVQEFLARYNRDKAVEPLTFSMYHDTKVEAAAAYGVSGFPTTFLIDRDGRVVKRFIGPRHWDDKHFFTMVDGILAAPAN